MLQTHYSRRQCLGSLAGLAFAPAGSKAGIPKLSFSTLGCPSWEWGTILENAARWGFAGIELRGIKRQMDLPKLREFTGERLRQSLRELADKHLQVICLGSSAQMHEKDQAKRALAMDEGKRFIDLAHALSAPYVRVFGNNIDPAEPRQAVLDRVAAGLAELGRHARGAKVTVLLESHGDFHESPTLKQVFDAVKMPEVAFLWDAHHTAVTGKEAPAVTWAALGSLVRHVHLKDSVAKGNDRQYVLTGEGTVPVRETVQILRDHNYKGFYNLEWEKTWIPDLAEPEVVFPHFAEALRRMYGA
jgi:sugar phosphate isomerase/epimerase